MGKGDCCALVYASDKEFVVYTLKTIIIEFIYENPNNLKHVL